MNESSISWDPEVLKKFETAMLNIPELYRDFVSDAIKGKAEFLAQERNAQIIEMIDLVKAFMIKVPDTFKPRMIGDLKKVGIDIDKYMKKDNI